MRLLPLAALRRDREQLHAKIYKSIVTLAELNNTVSTRKISPYTVLAFIEATFIYLYKLYLPNTGQ